MQRGFSFCPYSSLVPVAQPPQEPEAPTFAALFQRETSGTDNVRERFIKWEPTGSHNMGKPASGQAAKSQKMHNGNKTMVNNP